MPGVVDNSAKGLPFFASIYAQAMAIHGFTKGVVFLGYAGANLGKYEVKNPK